MAYYVMMTEGYTGLIVHEDSVQEDVGRFSSTPEGKYSHADETLARLYGFDSPGELMSSITDIGRQLYLDPGRRKEFARLMRRDGFVSHFESPVRRKDGRVIWISENAREVRDDNGDLIGYEGTVVEIIK